MRLRLRLGLWDACPKTVYDPYRGVETRQVAYPPAWGARVVIRTPVVMTPCCDAPDVTLEACYRSSGLVGVAWACAACRDRQVHMHWETGFFGVGRQFRMTMWLRNELEQGHDPPRLEEYLARERQEPAYIEMERIYGKNGGS